MPDTTKRRLHSTEDSLHLSGMRKSEVWLDASWPHPASRVGIFPNIVIKGLRAQGQGCFIFPYIECDNKYVQFKNPVHLQ